MEIPAPTPPTRRSLWRPTLSMRNLVYRIVASILMIAKIPMASRPLDGSVKPISVKIVGE